MFYNMTTYFLFHLDCVCKHFSAQELKLKPTDISKSRLTRVAVVNNTKRSYTRNDYVNGTGSFKD